jgi:hypothetical protein
VWWSSPVIPALRMLRQADCEFEASLGKIARTHLKKKKKKKEKEKIICTSFCTTTKS